MIPNGLNVVVFDCEIKQPIDGKNVTWKTYDKMGISVACAFDYLKMDYQVYMDDNIGELAERLTKADLVVGFNILGFDVPLLEATIGSVLPPLHVYDILYESRVSNGWKPNDPYSRYPGGMKLDDHLEGTFGASEKKTESGADAPIFWQEGKLGRLISYCLADVKREKMLFEHICETGTVTTPCYGTKTLRKPF